MKVFRPNLKYEHLFVILRIDDYGDLKVPPESSIVVVKAFYSQKEAEEEVRRLNKLAADKDAKYFMQVARLKG